MRSAALIVLFLLLYAMKLNAQQVGHTTVTFIDSTRNNRQITTEVYYPATTAGNNTPIASGSFPLIAFGHGFVMTWMAYQNFWDLLVPEGYILAFPTTESGFTPDHADFGNDLKFLITKIQNSGAGASVPQTSVGAASAIMGHSMGGGSAFLSAANNTTITTMISFAAANTNPSAITAAHLISVPCLLFSGSNDCVTPYPQHQDIMYDSTTAVYKTQVYINGGGHCFFANYNFNCAFGEATCTPNPAITRAEQQAVVNDFLKPWLAYFLKGDCTKAQEFQDSLTVSSRITYRQSLSIACPTVITEFNSAKNIVSVFPNPADGFLNIRHYEENLECITIYDITNKQILEYYFAIPKSEVSIATTSLKSGIYFARVNDKHWIKFIKK